MGWTLLGFKLGSVLFVFKKNGKEAGVIVTRPEKVKVIATENHNLIYSFLYRNDLNITEFYDIVAIGYMEAVHDYLDDESLRRNYMFSSIAWVGMTSAYKDSVKWRRRFKRRRSVYSLTHKSPTKGVCLEDTLTSDATSNSINDALFWIDIRAALQDKLYDVAVGKTQGLTHRQIADKAKVSVRTVDNLVQDIKSWLYQYLYN